MILKIRSAGESVLRGRARPLTADEIRTPAIQNLIDSMRDTMRDAPGVGLAAPQVGLPLQLAVLEDRDDLLRELSKDALAERERKAFPFQVIINPVLTLESPPEVEFFEGCLSIPGMMAIVARARKVRVDCLDEHGQEKTLRATGWHARILQHEIDHLLGTLYVDRMRSTSLTTIENYTRYWRTKSIAEVKRLLP